MIKDIELLKEKGLKVTPQRIAIVDLLKSYGHLSISKMYELIKEKFPSISLATIYKNLNAMVDNGFVNEVKIIGQDSRYELAKASHSHVVCKECGVMEDIMLDDSDIKDEAKKLSKFDIQSSSITFYGICQKCATS